VGVILYRGLVAASVLGGAFLTYRLPNGPLLFWWLFSALAFGAWVAFSRKVTGLGARARRLVLLYCVLVSAALVSTQLAARRLTSATHVRFEGVLFERADSIVVASGESGVDVVLPTLSPAQTPWRLTLLRDEGGWHLAPRPSVELVRVSPAVGEALGPGAALIRASTGAERHTVLNGVVLDGPGDVAVIRGPDGVPLDTLALAATGVGVSLRSTRGSYALDPGSDRLAARYRRMLRIGTSLGSLDGQRAEPAAFDRFVRVQRLSVREEVNGNAAGWLDWLAASSPLSAMLPGQTTRLLVSAAAPFSVDGGAPGAAPPHTLPDSVRVEVRHLGGTWRFDLVQMRREPTAEVGLAVRFVRNPRPFDSPLPRGDSCSPGVACGLLSLRRLPPPVAHIALDGAGLDPSRFALLARLEDAPDGVRLVLPQGSVTIPLGGPERGRPTAVPVTDLDRLAGPDPGPTEPRSRGPWLLLAASSNYVDDAGVLLLVCLGVTALLFLTSQLIASSAGARTPSATPRERFLVLGLNAILALLLTRLIIGARLTFFEPYLPAGLDTAIGLWVAVSVVTLGLLSWSAWAPRLLKWGRALTLQGRLTSRGLLAATRAAFAPSTPGGGPRRVGRALLLTLTLALLAWVSLPAAAFGLVCGLAVLCTWFTIAWTAAFSGRTFHSFEDGPFEVVEHQGDGALAPWDGRRGLPEGDVLLLPLLWAATVWQPALGVLAALALSSWRLLRAGRSGDPPGRAGSGIGERRAGARARATLVPVLAGQVVSTTALALLTALSENGALATFVLVILVALVGVRSGRALAARISRNGTAAAGLPVAALPPGSSEPTRLPALISEPPAARPRGWSIPAWTMSLHLVAPLLLLLPLAVIDMGLLLVMVIPIGVASLLAVGLHRLTRRWQAVSALLAFGLVSVLFSKVLFPDVRVLSSDDPVQRAERFEEMQRVLGVKLPVVGASLERAAARAVAARDQRVAEELLVAARPGLARDLLLPSIEQAWASRAYSAAGAWGVGLGAAPIGRGVAEAVSYAENSFAVYVLHEHGVVGGVAVMLAYLTFAVAVMLLVRATPQPTESLRASRAMFLVAALIVTIPAVYVALSNVGVVPITGQNMPFLGLNAWSDVTLCAGIVGILVTGAIRTETGAGRWSTREARAWTDVGAHSGRRAATGGAVPGGASPAGEDGTEDSLASDPPLHPSGASS
jgi:hypothetical protein